MSPLVLVLALTMTSTMRVDYYHTGNATQEHFSLDRVVIEPLPWPGNPAKPIDTTLSGKYFFTVTELRSGRPIYSRGFSSIFGEWETTAEALAMNRTFSESLRFPAPSEPVRILLEKRDARNRFQPIWNVTIDPADKFIVKMKPSPEVGRLLKLHEAGGSAEKLDLLILGDGYTAAERGKFERDARRLMGVLLRTSPFKERARDINVWGLSPPAAESGISRPADGVYRRSPLGATYDAFGTARYILTFENRAFRDIASNAPYEVVEILANSREYGGGGIFGQYGTVAAGSAWSSYVFVHEFGHHLAGLADEYYTSDVAYLPSAEKVEPWEPNATALLDPSALKWKELASPATPIPTPWLKDEYERLSNAIEERRRTLRSSGRADSEIDALLRDEQARTTSLLASGPYAGKVGAYEGANYEAKGYYRPEQDCIMFSRNPVPFCLVCRRAIEAILDLYSRR
jgi:hypothetical protein